MNDEAFANWFRGFFDAEGSFLFQEQPKNRAAYPLCRNSALGCRCRCRDGLL